MSTHPKHKQELPALHPNDVRHIAQWDLSDRNIGLRTPEDQQRQARWVKITYDAVRSGSVKNLTQLIEAGFITPTNPALPKTLPLLAIHKLGSKVLRSLHQAGFDLTLTNRSGQRVWTVAIERQLDPIIDTLIALGIDPDHKEELKGQAPYYYSTNHSKYSHENALNVALDVKSLSIVLKLWDCQVLSGQEQEWFETILNKTRPHNAAFRIQLLKALEVKGIHPTESKLFEPVIGQLNAFDHKEDVLGLIRVLCEQGIPFPSSIQAQLKHSRFKEELFVLQETAHAYYLQNKLNKVLPESDKPIIKPFRL